MAVSVPIKIKPYEGKPRGWLFISAAILIVLSLVGLPAAVKALGYILFGLVLLFTGLNVFGRTVMLTKGKWARLHYPLMVRFAAVAGYLQGSPTPPLKDDYDFILRNNPSQHAAWLLLSSVVSDKTQARELWSSAAQRVEHFSDKAVVKKYMLERNPSITKSQLIEVLKEAKETLILENAKMTIAELVAMQYGEAERDKYVIAVLTEQAS